VAFGEYSNITNLGVGAFAECFAFTSITLPDKLKVIEGMAFGNCTSLERVVCNKNLKTIGDGVFQDCSKLEDVQFASSSISFGEYPFNGCDRLIELTVAAGFPSNTFTGPNTAKPGVNKGDGIPPYLVDPFERSTRSRANERGNAKSWTTAKTRCLLASC